MRDFPLTFNTHVYNDIDFAYQKGYRDVYPDLLTDVPPSFDLMTVGNTGVTNVGMWTDLITQAIFPEPCNVTLMMSTFKAFFPGQILLFRDFSHVVPAGKETKFYLRVKSYAPETGQLYGTIEGVHCPRDNSTWVVTVAGSEVMYNAAKVMPFSAGGTGARAALQARDSIFSNSLISGIPEIFEDFSGYGDSAWGNYSSHQKFRIQQTNGVVSNTGEGPVATIGTNWIGVSKLTLGFNGSPQTTDIAGVIIRNNTTSDYFGIMNLDAGQMIEFIGRIYIPALGTGGNDYRLNIGLFRSNNFLSNPATSGGFNLSYKNATNAGNWVVSSGGTIVTTTNTATAPVVGWNILRILYDPATGNLTCYHNGTLIATVSISPSNGLFTGAGGQDLNNAIIPGALVYSDSTNTTQKDFYLDYLFCRGRVVR